ncbi:uncharacterized protein LOC133330210 [Musca vetustissima]|uniref:uncharacterized protein LOC133330210 n=1 Tax=Musca vetustissima TaxID=27455 RepID=UPI002AB6C91E|nr:uncharacterized protein LOC133330210 [Musca vetustissima]XP_061394658.1 uncharacterized protein LOC133330210 [Musca vetustissima]XP_061394659.1 uncharacterized protein LOC133330210 [Musca vetustissima]
MSKRNYKRLIKKQKILYKNRSLQCEQENSESEFVSNGGDFINDFVENGMEDFAVPKLMLRDKLKKWCMETNPSKKCLESLLSILKEEGLDVPLTRETLVGRAKNMLTRNVAPGIYCHIGIEKQLRKVGHILEKYEEVELDINIDGIPLFKSSRVQLWPILCRIVNIQEKTKPFVVGLYLGNTKPGSVNVYLKDFIDEVILLKGQFIIQQKHLKLKFRCLICDAPAKAFVCGVPGHTSTHGCTKCTQIAKKVNNVLTYSSESGSLISDEDFAVRKYPCHHSQMFKEEKTPLEEIGFGMINQTPLDSMHLIDLGVTKKMLTRIMHNKTEKKTSKQNISKISSELVKFKKYIPREFPRKPRPLDDLCHWKATEFHQFLAYTGIIALYNNVHEDIYYEFLTLHCAYRLLNNARHMDQNIVQANNLLQLFVENFSTVFGSNSISFNVHNLLHLASCAEKYGPLISFSAYAFENKLQTLKKHVRKPSHIFQQIIQKEKNCMIVNTIQDGLKYEKGVIVGAFVNDCYISCKEPDNICAVNSCIPIKIDNIKKKGEIYIEGSRILALESFYEEPVNSCEIGIFKTNLTLGEKETFCIKDIQFKFVCLPIDSDFVIVPILHSCFPEKYQAQIFTS